VSARIRWGDTVVILSGKDRGKSGKVREVRPKENRVVVEGLNIVKRHTKARGPGQPGGIIEKEAALHLSNVAVADPRDGKPTRVGFRLEADGNKMRKVRFAKKSGQTIPDLKPGS